MFDYGLFRFSSKREVLEKSIRYWNPGKTRFWLEAGIDLVIDRREGYCLYDMDGRRLIDLHINAGTFNFGHRNPELVQTLKSALDRFDIGNHWFPSVARTALAEALVKISPGFEYAFFTSGGAEAVDQHPRRHRQERGRQGCHREEGAHLEAVRAQRVRIEGNRETAGGKRGERSARGDVDRERLSRFEDAHLHGI